MKDIAMLTEADYNTTLELIDDERSVAIPLNNDGTALCAYNNSVVTTTIENNYIVYKEVPKTHPIIDDVKNMGGEFRLAGYMRDDVFYAFDYVQLEYTDLTYAERMQRLANILAETATSSIKLAHYLQTSEEKFSYFQEITKEPDEKRMVFMNLDENFNNGSVFYCHPRPAPLNYVHHNYGHQRSRR